MLDFEEQGSHYIEERALCKVLQEATPHKPVQKEGEVCPLLRKEHSRALCGSRKLAIVVVFKSLEFKATDGSLLSESRKHPLAEIGKHTNRSSSRAKKLPDSESSSTLRLETRKMRGSKNRAAEKNVGTFQFTVVPFGGNFFPLFLNKDNASPFEIMQPRNHSYHPEEALRKQCYDNTINLQTQTR
ncbi:unnamed protein product [Enterobius vermicularis]|uniref:Uncharacterized protein n=1 Tax=Enterobius vermicularis TaxID=51028 RepID=A0A0N4VMS0_ENTVE|nr:unnamed protein product [Enterobius vermicularis]